MPLVVADAAPINYLILIGHVDLLQVLLEKAAFVGGGAGISQSLET